MEKGFFMSNYDPFKKRSFSRIANEILSNENLSDGAKIVFTFLGGQFGLTKDGVMNLKMEDIAMATGTKTIRHFDTTTGFIKESIPTRQTERHIKELKKQGFVETKKLKRGISIWFVKHDPTNLTGLFRDDNLDPTDMTNRPDKSDESKRSDHYIKNINKEKRARPLNYSIQGLRHRLPKDVRYKQGITFVLKDGLDVMEGQELLDLLVKIRSESHTDFVGVLKKHIEIRKNNEKRNIFGIN